MYSKWQSRASSVASEDHSEAKYTLQSMTDLSWVDVLWTKPQPMEGSPQNSSLLAQAAATETPMLEQFVPEGLLPAEIHVLENLCSMGRAYAGAVE